MAQELGLGVTPYGAFAAGVLSGKYTRDNASQATPRRGGMVTGALNENTFRLLDVLSGVARELQTSSARVALAWTRLRPGVCSIIIGARTMEQLDENLGGSTSIWGPNMLAALDRASQPRLAFPVEFSDQCRTARLWWYDYQRRKLSDLSVRA